MCSTKIILLYKDVLTIPSSILTTKIYMTFHRHNNLHFNTDFHMHSENYKESNHGLDSNLLHIL